MRISDWSSDVCSSDLGRSEGSTKAMDAMPNKSKADWDPRSEAVLSDQIKAYDGIRQRCPVAYSDYLGWSLDRKSVVSGKSVSVRVDLGGCRIFYKKTRELLSITQVNRPI